MTHGPYIQVTPPPDVTKPGSEPEPMYVRSNWIVSVSAGSIDIDPGTAAQQRQHNPNASVVAVKQSLRVTYLYSPVGSMLVCMETVGEVMERLKEAEREQVSAERMSRTPFPEIHVGIEEPGFKDFKRTAYLWQVCSECGVRLGGEHLESCKLFAARVTEDDCKQPQRSDDPRRCLGCGQILGLLHDSDCTKADTASRAYVNAADCERGQ